MKTLTALFVALAMVSCTKKTVPVQGPGPEEVVKSFIELSAAAKDKADREKLMGLCTGELRRAFERMTEEAFQISYLNSNVSVQELKVLEAKVDGQVAKIHYRVAIQNPQGTDETREVNEREVELNSQGGLWQIESIRTVGSDQIAFTHGMMF